MADLENRTTLAAGRFVRLVSDEGWEFAERLNSTGVVVIVPVTDEGELVLTEQFRKPVGRRVVDLPAGLAGDGPGGADEAFVTAAQRELVEETGYEAREMVLLAEGPSSAGLTSEIVTFYRAGGLTKVGPGGGDESEEIDVHLVPLESITTWLDNRVRQDCYIDPKVYVGLYFVLNSD